MCGTRTTFLVHVPQKVGIFGASKQAADLSNLYRNGSKTCIRSQSTQFSRNTGYRPRLFAMVTILPPSTPRGSTARHVRIGQRVSARRGPIEDLKPGSRRHQRARKYGLVTASVGPKLWTVRWDDGAETAERSAQLRVELPTAGEELTSSPHGDDHTNWKLVPAHPSNALSKFCVELLPVDSAVRTAPTEGNGKEIAENINFENQPTLPTDASPSAKRGSTCSRYFYCNDPYAKDIMLPPPSPLLALKAYQVGFLAPCW
jgi:hypothetical protein